MLRRLRKQSSQLSDRELLEKYKSGSELEPLGLLYERYVELVYGVCLKYLREEMAAEDAVMNIFEELIEKVKKHDIRQFRSWLHVLTKNHCLMVLRKQRKDLTLTFEPELMQSIDSRHLTIEIEDNGQIEDLKSCMEALPEKQKRCIELFYFDGQSYKEIAAENGEKIGKVRSYIQNGRRNLKSCMEKKSADRSLQSKSEKR